MVNTGTMAFKVGPVSVEVRTRTEMSFHRPRSIPNTTWGSRFYRLAQASDDLYDAYRNMYLAFESMLSARYPKTQAREIDWLQASLASAAGDLSLAGLRPLGTTRPTTSSTLSTVALDFPCSTRRTEKRNFWPVESAAARKTVETALDMLTHIVLRMADVWFSARRLGGWVNPSVAEQGHAKIIRRVNVCILRQSFFHSAYRTK